MYTYILVYMPYLYKYICVYLCILLFILSSSSPIGARDSKIESLHMDFFIYFLFSYPIGVQLLAYLGHIE